MEKKQRDLKVDHLKFEIAQEFGISQSKSQEVKKKIKKP